MCMQAAKALGRLLICAGSPEPLMPNIAMSTKSHDQYNLMILPVFLCDSSA